ncbi:unnamed protein product [Adineta steineri]|uniref:Uncharacterized protein n=1 Tax=Adineta steineri TaxID=433720 RepID=A0A815E9Y5_9BILA|nr:unnamed protein product [Adineta steineri]CAF1307534.1 unnamed protein product [Adineta steineri]CAF1308623.1 unnamed protein product [Adineta steineri]
MPVNVLPPAHIPLAPELTMYAFPDKLVTTACPLKQQQADVLQDESGVEICGIYSKTYCRLSNETASSSSLSEYCVQAVRSSGHA